MSPFRRIPRSFTTLLRAQFGALAFLLLCLTFFKGVLLGLFFLLFLFLRQIILSLITAIFLYSMSSIGLVKVVLMRRDRSRWQLPPDSLSECFTSFTDLHAPESFVESAELIIVTQMQSLVSSSSWGPSSLPPPPGDGDNSHPRAQTEGRSHGAQTCQPCVCKESL